MGISLFLAEFWGWFAVILSVILLLRRSLLLELFRLAEDRAFLLISGFIALILGILTLSLHNLWVSDWRVLVTIFGWLSLLKGISLIAKPELLPRVAKPFKENSGLGLGALVAMLILGVCLLYVIY